MKRLIDLLLIFGLLVTALVNCAVVGEGGTSAAPGASQTTDVTFR